MKKDNDIKYNYKKTKNDEVTLTYDVSVPWSKIVIFKDKAFNKLQNDLEVDGFRKGKVPKNIAEKHISQNKILNNVAQDLVQDIYAFILKEENIKPVIQPKIDLKSTEDNKDWNLKIQVALNPEINYDQVKKVFSEVKDQKKTDSIWTPEKGKPNVDQNKQKPTQEEISKKLQLTFEKLLKQVKCQVSSLILESELEKKLTLLIDDLQKAGLTMDAYLSSKKTSIEQLRDNLKKEINNTYALEFILNSIILNEKITVEQKDLDSLINEVKDQKSKEAIQQNAYFYASYLLRQKAIDFLINL